MRLIFAQISIFKCYCKCKSENVGKRQKQTADLLGRHTIVRINTLKRIYMFNMFPGNISEHKKHQKVSAVPRSAKSRILRIYNYDTKNL